MYFRNSGFLSCTCMKLRHSPTFNVYYVNFVNFLNYWSLKCELILYRNHRFLHTSKPSTANFCSNCWPWSHASTFNGCWISCFRRYKLNGGNFRIDIPQSNVDVSGFNIPEDLVGVQSYLRWERRGKQNYSPEQEKVWLCDEGIIYRIITFCCYLSTI